MDHLLSWASHKSLTVSATECINALMKDGTKESFVFCFGEDKREVLKALKALVRTMTDVLGEHDYRVNHAAFDHVKKNYLQRLSERVGSLSDKTLNNCPALFDVFKITMACSLDGIPAIFISYYPQGNPNVSVCGQYEQPEFTLRVPLIFGSTSIYNESNKNRSPMISFGISCQNLKKVRARLKTTGLPLTDKSPKLEASQYDKQPTAQSGGESSDSEYEETFGGIPDNISHERTIVDTLRAGTFPVVRRRRQSVSLR